MERWAQDLAESQALFDAGKFFEAHERLEDAWRRESGARKLCAQGLTQVCAAFHKLSLGAQGLPGARELLEKGCAKLSAAPEGLATGAAAGVVSALSPALAALKAGDPPTAPALDWTAPPR